MARRMSRVISMSERVFVCWSAVACDGDRSRALTLVLSGGCCCAKSCGVLESIAQVVSRAANTRFIGPPFLRLLEQEQGRRAMETDQHAMSTIAQPRGAENGC